MHVLWNQAPWKQTKRIVELYASIVESSVYKISNKRCVLYRDKDQLIIGEENCVVLLINPRNDGEGAYEAELHIKIPPEADYTGVERNNKVKKSSLHHKRLEQKLTLCCI